MEGAPWSLLLAPACLVLGLVCVAPGAMSLKRPWVRMAIVAVVWLSALRYLYWRATETLVTEGNGFGIAWSLLCFTVELLALWDGALLYLAFARTTDRRSEADAGEVRMRALTPAEAPPVDVFITSYNEPLGVLEKTIVGALSLDWPNLKIWVLDDGRRAWLRDYCQEKGVGYITRPDNKGAKAGNVNHALSVTDGEFVVIFDADFVPQREFLMRAMGLFADPSVGIVQAPHAFYNHDPMQTNLGMRKSLPDDQRFFFESIMPSRDGWNAAFCCGSNSVTRRSALRAVGDGLPEGSITEDMLLSLVMLRQGFVTRYLCERLAYGLAPESVSAFFVQRQRWARGAIQILFLKAGPLGPGLKLTQRLLFMPTHWLTQSLMSLMCLVSPIVFLLTGVAPMAHTSLEAVCFYLAPMLLATCGGLVAFAPGKYNPLAAQVLATFQSFKLLPTVIATFWRPHGHAFKVTPKGADATGEHEHGIFLACAVLIALTVAGLAINLSPEWRLIDDVALVPLVALWCGFNLVVLFLVSVLCLQAPVRRAEERFAMQEPVVVRNHRNGALVTLMSVDMSLSGVGLTQGAACESDIQVGDIVSAYISSVGWTPGRVARTSGRLGLRFEHDGLVERDLLIRKLFTSGRNTATDGATTLNVTLGLLQRIWTANEIGKAAVAPNLPAAPEPRLPAVSLVVKPTERAATLEDALRRLQKAA